MIVFIYNEYVYFHNSSKGLIKFVNNDINFVKKSFIRYFNNKASFIPNVI